jgi:para-nitrobenzyl esterase
VIVVGTAFGKVRGTEIADGVLGWRGIPYAAPPTGELRLRPPLPPEPWQGIRNAAGYGNRAPQPPGQLPDPAAPPTGEDCLYLNVTAPADAAGRPVLLWIHGGGYETGSGPDLAGDGAAFARTHGIVVVTFNYRLGALGFLDVEGESPTGAFGLHDQIAALRWTRENIFGFGGDPEQITVYGLSAGAKAVTNLLASPLASGMIRRAASSSGGDHVKSQDQARALAARFFRELGTTPDRIRAVPARDILAAQRAIAIPPRSVWIWRPSIDGAALTTDPVRAIEAGAAAGIPLLTQTCARECAFYQLMAPDAAGQADRVLTECFGERAKDKILAAYAADYPGLDATGVRVAIMTDERYVVRTDRLADAQSAHAPVWRSRYDGPHTGFPDPDSPEYAQLAPFAELARAGHASDGAGIWQGGDGLSGRLHDAWGAFVVAGDPGWDRYTTPERHTMIFSPADPHVAADPFANVRRTWDGLDWQPGPWWHHDGVA